MPTESATRRVERRADRAATLAAAYQAQAAESPERLRSHYLRTAELHRRMRERQLSAGRVPASADRGSARDK